MLQTAYDDEEEEGEGLIEASTTPGSPVRAASGTVKGAGAAASAGGKSSPWGLAGKGLGASSRLSGAVTGHAASGLHGPELEHRRELLDFCRSAAVLISQHKHEATAQGVPIVREGEGEVEDIQ